MAGGIVLRVAHKFQNRFVEWLAGFQIMFWGLILLRPGDTFANSRIFDLFLQYGSENFWGAFMFFAGFIRIAGLIVNGSRHDVTPWIRASGAIIGFVIFAGISLSFLGPWLHGQMLSPGLGMYPPAAVAELVSLYFSIKDARAYRDGLKRNP